MTRRQVLFHSAAREKTLRGEMRTVVAQRCFYVQLCVSVL